MLISHNKVLLEPCNEEINIKEIITVKDATYELVQRKPELCDTSAGLEQTTFFFNIVTTAEKEKPTM